MSILTQQKRLFLHNAYNVRQEIRYYDSTVDAYVPWDGTDLRVRFSADPTGYDVNGYPTTLLGPFTMYPTGDPGWFYYSVPADSIAQALGAMVGQLVYQIVEGSYGTTYYDLTDSQPLLIVDPRAPLP